MMTMDRPPRQMIWGYQAPDTVTLMQQVGRQVRLLVMQQVGRQLRMSAMQQVGRQLRMLVMPQARRQVRFKGRWCRIRQRCTQAGMERWRISSRKKMRRRREIKATAQRTPGRRSCQARRWREERWEERRLVLIRDRARTHRQTSQGLKQRRESGSQKWMSSKRVKQGKEVLATRLGLTNRK